MSLLNLTCQSCGGRLVNAPGTKFYVCESCGNSFKEEAITNVYNNSTTIQNANIVIEKEKFEDLIKPINAFLEIDKLDEFGKVKKSLLNLRERFPYKAELWWALIRCDSLNFRVYGNDWCDSFAYSISDSTVLPNVIKEAESLYETIQFYKKNFSMFDGHLISLEQDRLTNYIAEFQTTLSRLNKAWKNDTELVEKYNRTKETIENTTNSLISDMNEAARRYEQESLKKLKKTDELSKLNLAIFIVLVPVIIALVMFRLESKSVFTTISAFEIALYSALGIPALTAVSLSYFFKRKYKRNNSKVMASIEKKKSEKLHSETKLQEERNIALEKMSKDLIQNRINNLRRM